MAATVHNSVNKNLTYKHTAATAYLLHNSGGKGKSYVVVTDQNIKNKAGLSLINGKKTHTIPIHGSRDDVRKVVDMLKLPQIIGEVNCGTPVGSDNIYWPGETEYALKSMTTNRVYAAGVYPRALETLSGIKSLPNGWDGESAQPLSEELIVRASELLEHLQVEPEIYPTGRSSIQFEYEKENGKYLEFEIYMDKVCYFMIDLNGDEREGVFSHLNPANLMIEMIEEWGQ